jgi:hypothetical protein
MRIALPAFLRRGRRSSPRHDRPVRVVDNQIFLLGLDELYRKAMARHEGDELLTCARRVAAALHVLPATEAVEGYYDEQENLAEYFQFIRALQRVETSRAAEVATLPEFRRLREVLGAPLFGPRQLDSTLLFPPGRDPLSQAMLDTRPDWTVSRLTAAAQHNARVTDDISLVGLAALAGDSVLLGAFRESMVLYAEWTTFCLTPQSEVLWQVDEALAARARRFIAAFNTLFAEDLPSPEPAQAERFWDAHENNHIIGRCVRLGEDESVPPHYYHWAICYGSDRKLVIHEFWDANVWTTDRYRDTHDADGQRKKD